MSALRQKNTNFFSEKFDFSTFSALLDDFRKSIKRIEYNKEMEVVAEVFQKQQAVTRANCNKPVLATFGIGPCISIVGYEPISMIGFLTHYDSLTEIKESFTNLLIALYKAGAKEENEFQVRLVSNFNSINKADLELIKILLKHGTAFKMKLIEEDTRPSETDLCKSIALDTRSGEVYSYDPSKNPFRDINGIENVIMKAMFRAKAEFSYNPTNNK